MSVDGSRRSTLGTCMGADPFIVPVDGAAMIEFSAWTYAEERPISRIPSSILNATGVSCGVAVAPAPRRPEDRMATTAPAPW